MADETRRNLRQTWMARHPGPLILLALLVVGCVAIPIQQAGLDWSVIELIAVLATILQFWHVLNIYRSDKE